MDANSPNIMDQLKAAALARIKAGVTKYRIAKDAGLEYQVLNRLMENPEGVEFKNAAKLASFLGLELRPVEGKRQRK